jgi:hypothetical protein
MDWGLLQSQSKNWFLRGKLLIPYRSVYFGAMVSKKNTWQIRIILLALVAQNWNCGARMKWKKNVNQVSNYIHQLQNKSWPTLMMSVMQVLNVLLRFAWLQTVLNFRLPFLHRQSLVAIVASLEIIGRGIWNFFWFDWFQNSQFHNRLSFVDDLDNCIADSWFYSHYIW